MDAYYYPDRSDLSTWVVARDLASLDECRDYVFGQASLRNDPNLVRGYFECGVGKSESFGGLSVYRLTVR